MLPDRMIRGNLDREGLVLPLAARSHGAQAAPIIVDHHHDGAFDAHGVGQGDEDAVGDL